MNPPIHRTCSDLCADPASSPHGNTDDEVVASVTGQFTGWSLDTAPTLSGAELLEEVLLDMGNRMTGGIGVFVQATGVPGGHLKILHSVLKHPGPTKRGQTCACCGDVLDLDIETVQLDSSLLDATPEQRIAADPEYQQELFDADPTPALIPNHADGAARTTAAKTRGSMHFPTALLPHVLEKDLTPKQAFETLTPVIEDLGYTTGAKPLIDFLTVASTRKTGEEAGTAVQHISAGVLQGAREMVQDRRENLLHGHLPGLKPTRGAPSDPALLGILSCMQDQRNATLDDLSDRKAERAKTATPKTVEDKWPTHVDRLCKLCAVEDPADLPLCWHNAAAWKKGGGTALTSALNEATALAAAEMGVMPPRVTVQHANALQNWTFVGASMHDIGAGLLPLTITPPGATSLKARQRLQQDYENAADHTTMIQGNTSISTADARELRSGGACVPVGCDEAEASLEAYGALLGGILGTQHPVVTKHLASLKSHRRVRQQLKQITTTRMGEPLAAATICYHYHVQICCWPQEQWDASTADSVEPPAFEEGFRTFARGNNPAWLPDTTLVDQFSALRPRADGRGENAGGSSAPAPVPTPTPSPTPAARPQRVRARNRNRDPRLIGQSPLAVATRKTAVREALNRAGAAPETNGNVERCLQWHLKGNCYADCPRHEDHVLLEGDEKEALHQWCKSAHAQEWGIGRRRSIDRTVAVPPPAVSKVTALASKATGPSAPLRAGPKQIVTPESGKPVNIRTRLSLDSPSPDGGTQRAPVQVNQRRPPMSPWAATIQGCTPRRPPSLPRATVNSKPAQGDELDHLMQQATTNFIRASSWAEFFDLQRDPRGDWGEVKSLPHRASHLLHHCKSKGVPVKMKHGPWSADRKHAALMRGPHKSAKEHREFLREECTAMIKKGHWALLPAHLLLEHEQLRLSPLGVVPQRERRPRTISDCSYFKANADTAALAPPEAMQFGRALQRTLQRIFDANPRYGPVYPSKTDTSDGFCRIGLRPEDALKLAVIFPVHDGEEALIGIPLTLPVGWAESPPAFCTATETVADLANAELASDPRLERQVKHRLDDLAECCAETANNESSESKHAATSRNSAKESRRVTPVPESAGKSTAASVVAHNHASRLGSSDNARTAREQMPANRPVFPHNARTKLCRPVRQWDACVDDFLGLAQGSKATRRKIKRALLHSLDRVFRPLEPNDNPCRQEPASVKKLKKGDATWATRKVMLGWTVDTKAGTMELPPHRVERLHDILASIQPGQRCVATKHWHKVLGELRSMAIAIPGARGLFSVLQEALRHEEVPRARVRLNKITHEFLNDFRWMAKDMTKRPTRISELIPTTPTVVGACDAAGPGMGGAFFVPTRHPGELIPCLWRQPFPSRVQQMLVSFDNPEGSITNSDLELCGNIAHHDVVAQAVDTRERTIWTASDNAANVHWQRKGSTTTTGPAAHLLRTQALHQRFHQTVMARMPARTRDAFEADLIAAQDAIVHGVSAHNAKETDRHWELWSSHCLEIGIDPFLRSFQDPVPYLSVFAHRYREGTIAPSKRSVRSAAVSAALRLVGQTCLRLGTGDPRLSPWTHKLDFRLTRQLGSCTKKDPPPNRVRPAPMTLITFLLNLAYSAATASASETAFADMICVAFFFLLRPGECTGTTTDDAAFTLADVSLHLGRRKLNLATSPINETEAATCVNLHFTTQKNQRKGDALSHGRSVHPFCCPVKAIIRLILAHRRGFEARNEPVSMKQPLASYFRASRVHRIRAIDVTNQLRFAAAACCHGTGLAPKDVSARSLRAGGAMALLCGDVDTDVIKLLGRWHSDAMMQYLHQDCMPVMQRLARRMHNNGRHDFLPTHAVPSRASEPQDDPPDAPLSPLPLQPPRQLQRTSSPNASPVRRTAAPAPPSPSPPRPTPPPQTSPSPPPRTEPILRRSRRQRRLPPEQVTTPATLRLWR